MATSILVASCLHMDSTYIGSFDSKKGIHSNWSEALRQLRKLVRKCNERSIDWLVLNGDIFHTGNPTPEAVRLVWRELGLLETTKVIGEPGNHDLMGINASHSDPLWVFFSEERWCHRVVTGPEVLDLDGFSLAVMPWHRVSGRTQLDQVGLQMGDEVRRMADEVSDAGKPSLFVGHLTTLTVSNSFSRRGSELVMGNTGLEAVVDEALLDEGPWQRYALGHIHRRQRVGELGKGLYTGSTHRVTFAEEEEKKGAYLYDYADDGTVTVTFLNLGGRKLATADLSSGQELASAKHENMRSGDYLKLILPHDVSLNQMAKHVRRTVDDLTKRGVHVNMQHARPPQVERHVSAIPEAEEASPKEIMAAYLEELEKPPLESKRLNELFAEIEGAVA